MQSIMLSINTSIFTFYFPIWIPFIYLFISSLIAVARTSKTMLNETGHIFLVPGLRGNALSFSPLKLMFAVSLSCMAFIMFR